MHPRAGRLILPLGAAVFATSLIGATLVPAAAAAQGAPKDLRKATLAGKGEAAKVVGFWSSTKLKKAVNYEEQPTVRGKLRMPRANRTAADGRPGSIAPQGAGGGVGRSANVNLPKTVGKVFFTFEGDKNLYWCSATSVQSRFRNLVATAGHCVYDTRKNRYADNWVFIPAYHQGKTPFGLYVGATVNTHRDFDIFEDYDYDYAFVNVYNGYQLKAPAEVDYKTYKEWVDRGGDASIKEEVVDFETYDRWLQKNGRGEVRKVETEDEVGPSYKGGIFAPVEVDKWAYEKAPALKPGQDPNSGDADKRPATGTRWNTVVEHVTKTEFEAYDGLGYKKVDEAGNYTITRHYVVKYVKRTANVTYVVFRFHIVKKQDVGRLGDNVGGQGFTWNRSVKSTVYAFGYPSDAHPDGNQPYSGHTMKWCYGTTAPMPASARYKLEEHVGIKCSFTPGANGGPLLVNYSGARRTGYLNGVVSMAWDTDGNRRYDRVSSPYFNGETYAIYKAAANLWTGSLGG
ncbi:trypsin-like serine peptidase [Rhizohabitans arisaemae]|uniref:trypsin-like serine peptidase n=1 Tax=Rhizohabitans arisaemae TaxID=2720610 RepID=UPI0024B155D6|nr:hypothetical protein [Rhizohabitans arisaemae]